MHSVADGIQEALEDSPSSVLCSRRKDLHYVQVAVGGREGESTTVCVHLCVCSMHCVCVCVCVCVCAQVHICV